MAWNPDENADTPVEDIGCDPMFAALVLRLPKIDSEWPATERAAWLRMFEAIADSLHPESKNQPLPASESHVRVKLPHAELEVTGNAKDVNNTFQQLMPASERKFIDTGVSSYSREAAKVAVEMIRTAGKPGHVWYNKRSGRIRVCAEDYSPEQDDVLVGVYDIKVRPSDLNRDIKVVRNQIEDEETA